MEESKREIMEAVGARIRQLRRAHSLSQEELALRAGLSPAYFGLVERGEKCPSIDTIFKIAAGLGLSPTELLRVPGIEYNMEDHLLRARELLSRVPSEKIDQVFKALEDIVGLLSDE